jgi:hypothetical protein
MKMKSLVKQTYGTRDLQPGDEFECHDKHARTLETLGRAVPNEEPPAKVDKRTRAYKRRDMTAEK